MRLSCMVHLEFLVSLSLKAKIHFIYFLKYSLVNQDFRFYSQLCSVSLRYMLATVDHVWEIVWGLESDEMIFFFSYNNLDINAVNILKWMNLLVEWLFCAMTLWLLPCGLVARIPGFHPGGPGSIPGMGKHFKNYKIPKLRKIHRKHTIIQS